MKKLLTIIIILFSLFFFAFVAKEIKNINIKSHRENQEIINTLKEKYCSETPEISECLGFVSKK